MSAHDTKPEFAEANEDAQELISKPVRDPSLDGLLEGFEDRIEHPTQSAKLKVHTPPSAHTDPFPEEPVVAPNLTAPLSALHVSKPKSAPPIAKDAKAPRHDPTFVLDREPTLTPRGWAVIGACGVAVAAALGVVVWVARSSVGEIAEPAQTHPDPPAASLSTSLVAPPPVVHASASTLPVPVVSAAPSLKPSSPGKPTKNGSTPASASGGMDHGLD